MWSRISKTIGTLVFFSSENGRMVSENGYFVFLSLFSLHQIFLIFFLMEIKFSFKVPGPAGVGGPMKEKWVGEGGNTGHKENFLIITCHKSVLVEGRSGQARGQNHTTRSGTRPALCMAV